MERQESRSLAEIIGELAPQLQQAISAFWVLFWAPDDIEVRIEINLWVPGGGGQYVATLPPDGVTLGMWAKYPTISARGSIEQSIGEQLADLEALGVLGQLNAARYDAVDRRIAADQNRPPFSWLVKTHAGSDVERIAWSMQLPSITGHRRPPLSAEEYAALERRITEMRAARRRPVRRQRSSYQPLLARYPGICARSGQRFAAGTPIVRTHRGWAIKESES